ncbi:death domain protein, partial [Cooperia oncophora]
LFRFRSCNLTCRLDGRWSPWSDWSPCSPTCHRFRTRTCTSPPPINGGRPCVGRELETVPSTVFHPRRRNLDCPTMRLSTLDWLVFLSCWPSLWPCVLPFFARGIVARKGSVKNIYYAESGADECIKPPPPVGSQFFTLGSTCSPSPLHPSMTLRSGKSGYSGYSANRNAGSRAALITECSSNSSSGGKRTLVRTSSNYSDDENYATLYDYLDEKAVGCLESSQAVLAAQVDQSGARLQLRKCGASLLIPENALNSDRMIYLAVSDQIIDRPKLQPGESALSSVVVLGECEGEPASPARLLLKPLILSIRHCASVFPRDNWSFILYADEGFGWQRVLTVGEENLNSTMYVHMEKPGRSDGGMGWCHVMLDNFARVMLAGRPRRASAAACKRVHLAAYGPSERPRTSSFDLRVYCVPETGAAMESVAKQEQHGRLLAESEHFLLNEKGDLCFCVEDVSEGFSTRGSALVEIPDTHHQWCSQNGLHCSITVCSDMKRSVDDFMARIVIYQKTNNAERHVLQVRFENNIYDKPPAEEDRVVTTDFNLPVEVKDELSQLLDPPTDPDRDWRGLAKKLHTDRYIQYFATRPGCSPTTLLLDLWEARECGSLRAAHDLLQTLRVMGRPDAVALLEQYLSHFSYVT